MKFARALVFLAAVVSSATAAILTINGTSVASTLTTASSVAKSDASKGVAKLGAATVATSHAPVTDKIDATGLFFPIYACDLPNGYGACAYWGIDYYNVYYVPPIGWDNVVSFIDIIDPYTACYVFINEPLNGQCYGEYTIVDYYNTPANFINGFDNNLSCFFCVYTAA